MVFRRRNRVWRSARLAGDAAAALLAFYGAFLLRLYLPLPFTRALLPEDRLSFFSAEWLVVLAAQVLVLYFFGFYDQPQGQTATDMARRLAAAMGLQGLLLVAYFFFANRSFPRSILILHLVSNLALVFVWRLFLRRFDTLVERRVALVGSGPAAREIARAIERHHWHGLRVAGFVPAPGEVAPGSGELGPCLGTVDDLPSLLAEGRVDDLILAGDAYPWHTRLIDRLSGVRPAGSSVLLLPGPFESLIGRMRYRWVHDVPLIEVIRESEWRINWPVKRLFDLAAGGVLLVLALPVMAVSALAVRLTSPGPVLYGQERIGRGRRPFTLWKFRTMRQDAERDGNEVLAQPDDPRLTPIGALLRRLRLDELPQLINVLAGDMSLVGPRPERPGFVRRYLAEVPGYAERFYLAPGLTGLAQVNGEYHSSAQNKLRYDLAYMANWTLWLDLSILFRTVKIVLTSRGV